MIEEIVAWSLNFVMSLWTSFTTILAANPLFGVIIMLLIITFIYEIGATGVDFSSKGLKFMTIILAFVVLAIVGYVMWTEYGIGTGLSGFLKSLGGG